MTIKYNPYNWEIRPMKKNHSIKFVIEANIDDQKKFEETIRKCFREAIENNVKIKIVK